MPRLSGLENTPTCQFSSATNASACGCLHTCTCRYRGTPPPFRGFSFLQTAINRTSRWPKASPLSGITAEECARVFSFGWVACYGVPLIITTDRGTQFTSSLWTHLATTLGCKLHHTTAYHLQSNGLVEHLHRSLKTSLQARLLHSNWIDDLPWTLLLLHTIPKPALGFSPAAYTLHHQPLLPGGLVAPPMATNHTSPSLLSHHCNPPVLQPYPDLQRCSHVFVRIDANRPPLERPYTGPFRVVHRDPKMYTLELPRCQDVVSVNHLKPTTLPSEDHHTCTRFGRLIHRPQRFL